MSKKITVYAPASMANISVGFDILGAAISPISGELLGDCITVESATQFSLTCKGTFASKLPKETESNIVFQCWKLFCEKLNKTESVAITLEKNMPIGSGLGSSACSVVGALYALNEFFDKPFTQTMLLKMMGTLEGLISGSVHYDNVAPCYLGGMQLIIDEDELICDSIPYFDDWYWIMAYSGIVVSTAKAREILPSNYPKQECILHGKYVGGFIHACYTKNQVLATSMLQDNIAEPFRKSLLPNYDKTVASVKKLGALAAGISGSGPTMFVIASDLTVAQKIEALLKKDYLQNDDGFTHICKIDAVGTRVI